MEENFLINRFLPLASGVYFDQLLDSSNQPPPGSSARITDSAELRITDDGNVRVTD